jgi:hypothetical protein
LNFKEPVCRLIRIIWIAVFIAPMETDRNFKKKTGRRSFYKNDWIRILQFNKNAVSITLSRSLGREGLYKKIG